MFIVTVLALEESTLQPVFGIMSYSVHDGDVMFGRQYVDLVRVDAATGKFGVDHTKLSEITEKEEDAQRNQLAKKRSIGRKGSGLSNMNSRNLSPGM